MPSVSSMKVHPMYVKPEERFPYTRYRAMGLIQIILGIILLALGTYDLVLHFYPQWYSTKCDFWRIDPCEHMTGDTYFWSPGKGLTWTIVSTPLYTGLMLVVSGFVGTCTCDTDCTSQRCLCHAFMSLSLLISVIFAPACVAVSFLQGLFAINEKMHMLRTVIPLCCGGLGIIAIVVSFVTMCLCCCFTDYDPEIPLTGHDDTESVNSHPSMLYATAPPATSSGPSTSGSRNVSPPRVPAESYSPDMLKAYIKHLSDMSNTMAEMLVRNSRSPQTHGPGQGAGLPLSLNPGDMASMWPGGYPGGYPYFPSGDERITPKQKKYHKRKGVSVRKKKKKGYRSSSHPLPTVTSSSANSLEDFDVELPGQASSSRLELAALREEMPHRTTSVV